MTLLVDQVTVCYEPGKPVVDDVSFSVGTNKWLGLLGPNGAGKSSLLRAIAGLVDYRGSIVLAGRDPARRKHRERALQVAFVPQEPRMPEGMTVSEYVLLGRTPHLTYLGSESRRDFQAASTALEMLHLASMMNRRLCDLSGGERRRVCLARALAQEASILLLDEPTSALDIGQGQNALELIGSLRQLRPMTIVTAMHDLTLAGQFSDQLVLLAEGRVVARGPASEVLTVECIRDFYQASVEVLTVDNNVVIVPTRAQT